MCEVVLLPGLLLPVEAVVAVVGALGVGQAIAAPQSPLVRGPAPLLAWRLAEVPEEAEALGVGEVEAEAEVEAAPMCWMIGLRATL